MLRYKVVPSTVHQCFKYYQDGEQKRIIADTKPFAITESFYADSQFDDLFVDAADRKSSDTTITKGKDKARFTIEPELTPELRQEIAKELAEEEEFEFLFEEEID